MRLVRAMSGHRWSKSKLRVRPRPMASASSASSVRSSWRSSRTKRFASVEEIAATVVFLCRRGCQAPITGVALPIERRLDGALIWHTRQPFSPGQRNRPSRTPIRHFGGGPRTLGDVVSHALPALPPGAWRSLCLPRLVHRCRATRTRSRRHRHRPAGNPDDTSVQDHPARRTAPAARISGRATRPAYWPGRVGASGRRRARCLPGRKSLSGSA